MKKKVLRISTLSMMLGFSCMQAFSLVPNPDAGEPVVVRLGMIRSASLSKEAPAQTPVMEINGTGKSETLTVVADGLEQDVTLTVTSGFTVSPALIKAGTEKTVVTVTNVSNLAHATGQLILRSGDVRSYVKLTGLGTPLAVKDLSQNPAYSGGSDEEMSFDGFKPGSNGYTFEIRAKVDDASASLLPYAVTSAGAGLMSYINSTSVGMYNSTSRKDGISNPSNGGTFYNTDGLYHTYRYAVAPDGHVFVYRDGIAIDTLRVSDYGLQPEWTVENGDYEENLIKNPSFEGEWNFNKKRNIVDRIEGWDVLPYDQYNSTQQIVTEERSNEVDQNNHVLSVDRYMWSDGWSAAEISQIVDVAPNEVYSFSALAKGGIKKDGTLLGSLRIQDMQNSDNKTVIQVTSADYQTYATDFETKANTKQIRVFCYLERDKWGASISELKVDDVKLTGARRLTADKIGFRNDGADIAYFSFDNTGAYAPAKASLTASVDTLTIAGTGNSETFTVDASELAGDIQVSATTGFAVYPVKLSAGAKNAKIRVTNLTTLAHNSGKVILRSGDMRAYVNVGSLGTELEQKDLSQSPVYAGGSDEEMSFDGFTPGENGYTIEFRAKVDDVSKEFMPYAVTDKGVGFKGYVTSSSLGLYNSTSRKDKINNPANGDTFYNTDGLYHTYRFAVASDNRMFIYRDGLAIDTVRPADFGLQPEWSVENGRALKNLLKNPNFEGEWNFNKSRNITDRIEGWDVSPYDQYNSTQDIVAEERSNEVDQNNHVLSVSRYMWSDGWAAAEISQLVDVAPNEIYSFSALAKGGIKKDGTVLGSLRIQDMQNADNKVTIPVTSDAYQTYACDFETKATTKQVRVFCYLERDKWGASITPLKVDDVKLTGYSRVIQPQIGFQNESSDIEYFNFDCTGAYAPAFPSLTAEDLSTAIDAVDAEKQWWYSCKGGRRYVDVDKCRGTFPCSCLHDGRNSCRYAQRLYG
ncbi:MAG: hypothetical protein LUD00_02565 [Prevotellaceae bacterium]|nr:hypothetical protein [Prevotellaceae bacterium]